jgi:rSAM/selenodomain-associated transferase 1
MMHVPADVPLTGSCAIAVMAKASVPGRVKTRLTPLLSAEHAARLNTAFLQDVAGNLLQASTTARIAPYIAYGPAGAETFFRDHVSRRVGLMECSSPDFGECLFRAITMMFDLGYSAACVLNADSPTLPTGYLIEAAHALACPGDRAVLGPSTDGGYYFLGLKKPHRQLFENIDWSTPSVGEQTRDRAALLGLEVFFLDPWYDVDDAAGLRQLIRQLLPAPHPSAAGFPIYAAPYTRAALSRLLDTTDLGLRLGVATPTTAPWIAP